MNVPRLVTLAAVAALIPAFGALAQDETPSRPGTAVVEVRGVEYPLGTDQPLIVFTERITDTPEGVFVVPLIFLQGADGQFTRLTPCDDITVICQSVYIDAMGPFEGTVQGDALGLGDEVLNAD